MNFRPLPTLVLTFFWLFASSANAEPERAPGLILVPSHRSVAETMDRLEAIVTAKGIRVFARIDHAKGADGVGIPLAPLQLLIIGNPKLGSHLMTANPTAGIDLPLKMLAWEDADGKVWLAYNDPRWIAERHGVQERDKVIEKMSGALAKFAKAAAAP
jgi:uncharacterized protein (DUF302 family)